ncbi:ABC transporter ATP-binding protein [Desulfoscipio geothermicus]|nr:ABC transporter ATP-binding protein [Desulfoscipio geothermicus]
MPYYNTLGFDRELIDYIDIVDDSIRADRGMVFQTYTLFPWLTVQKNVEFGLKIKGLDPASRRETSRHYIELVGLAGFENALPKALSGGMKQRVAIARALANGPQMLLMDEPFGALDAQTRAVMQDLLLAVWEKERTTVLFITHDIDAVLLADNVYVMSRRPGRIRTRIEVDIPRPRDHRVTVSPRFTAIKKEIMEMLLKYLEKQSCPLHVGPVPNLTSCLLQQNCIILILDLLNN